MIKGISIHIENEAALQNLFSMASRLGGTQSKEALPNTANALYEAATAIEGAWKGWAMGGQIPGVKNIPHPNAKVAASIHKTPEQPAVSDYFIYSEHPAMANYQNGVDETIDMKAPDSPWLNGKKSRVNKKDGSPYLIVPFTWQTRGVTGGSSSFRNIVPAGILTALRRREVSVVLGKLHTESNARGEEIPRDDYEWGGRITKQDAASARITPKAAFSNGVSADELRTRIVGMVRMWDSAYTKNTTGTYFTFRVISPKAAADKWIQRRHIEPHDVTGALKREFEDLIQQNVNAALQADLGL